MMNRRLCVASAIVLIVLAQAAVGADWPQWRGPQRDGISAESGWSWNWPAEGPPLLWKAQIGYGMSSFAVADGRVFAFGNAEDTDTVYCFDAATGSALWKYSYACPRDPLAYEGGPSSTPLVAGGRVYTLSKSGHCYCLDAQTGAMVWLRKFDRAPQTDVDYKADWGFAGSPLLVGGRLIVPVGTAGKALNPATGETLWDNGGGRSGYSSPVPCTLAGQEAFVLLSGHEVVGVGVKDGTLLWRLPWKTTWDQNAPDVIVSDNKLFVSTGHGVGCAQYDLTANPPLEIWRNKNTRNYMSSSVLWQGNLYGFDDNQLRCLNWATGEVRWTQTGTGMGSLLVADGKLVALTEKGKLIVAEASPEAYKPLAEAQILTGRCWAAPVLANGRVYARNAAGEWSV